MLSYFFKKIFFIKNISIKNIFYSIKIYKVFNIYPYNLSIYKLAFIHNSIAQEKNNERLEFLGDSVLNLIVTEMLYCIYPNLQEGKLTKLRSKIINRSNLNKISYKLNILQFVHYKINIKQVAIYNSNVLGNVLEAIIGAIYLDKGYKITKKFVINKIINPNIDWNTFINIDNNYKGKILEWGQKRNIKIFFKCNVIKYKSSNDIFNINIIINNSIISNGKNINKKKSEQLAAKKACKILKI